MISAFEITLFNESEHIACSIAKHMSYELQCFSLKYSRELVDNHAFSILSNSLLLLAIIIAWFVFVFMLNVLNFSFSFSPFVIALWLVDMRVFPYGAI